MITNEQKLALESRIKDLESKDSTVQMLKDRTTYQRERIAELEQMHQDICDIAEASMAKCRELEAERDDLLLRVQQFDHHVSAIGHHIGAVCGGVDVDPEVEGSTAAAIIAKFDEKNERIAELTRIIVSERAEKRSNDSFLTKRLCRVATLAGVNMPEMNYGQVAECAGTILGQIARAMEEK